MNEQPRLTPPEDELETMVQETARHFAYPLTPDITSRLRERQHRHSPARLWRAAAVALLAFIVVTLAVPEVRAFVLEIIRIGAVRIFLIEPTATTTITPTARVAASARPTWTPVPTPALLTSVLELPGETQLATAQSVMNNGIWLPAYPADLGKPNHVYVQFINASLVTLVWTVPDAPEQVRLSLEVLNDDLVATKLYSYTGQRQEVSVNGRRAEWLAEAHEIWYFGDREFRRLVATPVLIWRDADSLLTYRLEADLSLDEAIKVAESMTAP